MWLIVDSNCQVNRFSAINLGGNRFVIAFVNVKITLLMDDKIMSVKLKKKSYCSNCAYDVENSKSRRQHCRFMYIIVSLTEEI